MSKLVIHFENEDARDDFVDWLKDEGEYQLDDHLTDRGLDELDLNFVDDENIEVI